MFGPGIYGYQPVKVPDITKEFFSFLAKERDEPESSFVITIEGKSGTGKTTDALSIAYSMLKTDPKRFVAIRIGPFSVRCGDNEQVRRVRKIDSFHQVQPNDIVIADEFVSSGRVYRDELYELEKLVIMARNRRVCIIMIAQNDVLTRSSRMAHISITTLDKGLAFVESDYKRFTKNGVVNFSVSPLELEYKSVYETSESILLRPVIACAHCLGIVRETDTKCGYCGYSFETTVMK